VATKNSFDEQTPIGRCSPPVASCMLHLGGPVYDNAGHSAPKEGRRLSLIP
jgi:hypothetical protein